MEQFLRYIGLWVGFSLVTMLAYAKDKKRAKEHKWRTPELHLLTLGFFVGAPGALLGMHLFRHKTKHWYFWVINFLGLLWQIAVPVCYILLKKDLI